MPSRIRTTFAGALLSAVLAASPFAAVVQEASFRYRWTKGETVRYRMTQQAATALSGLPGGMDMNVDQTIAQLVRMTVQDSPANGPTTLQQTIESVKVDMKSPMGGIAYDSTSDAASPDPAGASMKTMFSAMIGQPFTIVLSPTGTVEKIEGFSAIAEKAFASVAPDPGLMGPMKGMFSDESMRNTIGQGFASFPERTLKVGESWSSQTTVRNPLTGALIMSVDSTLKALEGSGARQIATIVTKIAIKQDPSTPAQPNPLGMTVQLADGSGDGEIVFDVSTGRVTRSVTRTTLPMTMSGTGPDGTAMNMQSTVKSTMTVELVQQ